MSMDQSEGLENPVAKWTVIVTMAALVLMLVVATWLALSVRLDSYTRIDEDSGRIHIRGSETDFVGYATARYGGREVLIEGLPSTEQLKELPIAWRALCVVRDDPATDWSKANPMLEVHLHSEEMTEACRPFEGLEVEGKVVPENAPEPGLLSGAEEEMPGGL